MSLHFDMVINCDLREDTPENIYEAIQCLTQRDYKLKDKPELIYPGQGNIWDGFSDYHFLAPDSQHDVISNFRRVHQLTIPTENNREVHRYRLQYCGSWLHDDFFYAHHLPFVYWLATIAYEKYIGYYVETGGSVGVHHFFAENGKLKDRQEDQSTF